MDFISDPDSGGLPDVEPAQEAAEGRGALAVWLADRFDKWKSARKPQEKKLLDYYADAQRIPRDDDTKGTGQARAKKSRGIFIGSTRNKIRAARSKIKDWLFGAGDQLPFDMNPADAEPEKKDMLKPFADAMEEIISRLLREGGFREAVSAGINSLCTYGTAFIAGPFTRIKRHSEVSVGADPVTGALGLRETITEYDEPYFELLRTLDVYPDPDAGDTKRGNGVFWVTRMTPEEVGRLRSDPRYSNVDEVMRIRETIAQTEGAALAENLRGLKSWFENNRIAVARYFGLVPRNLLFGTPNEPGGASDDDEIETLVVMAGGVVIRAEESSFDERPIHRAVYEDVEHELWGVGIGENNEPFQKVLNASVRLFLEGKGMALLPPMSVDRSKFYPSEDFKLTPGKVLSFQPNLTPEEKKEAYQIHIIPDVTDGWSSVIRLAQEFSDDDTGITKYTQGDDARHLNKTATGVSMIMNVSNLPLKEVMQNIDHQWIVPCIEALIEWCFESLSVETVRLHHGDKTADLWRQIKEYGKDNFVEWNPTGASTMMAREALVNKLQGYLAIVGSNPAFLQLTEAKTLLEHVWDALDTGLKSPVRDDSAMAGLLAQGGGMVAPAPAEAGLTGGGVVARP